MADPIAALAQRHQQLTGDVRRRVLAYVEQAWGQLGSHRTADIERFVRAVVPIVEGGQVQLAALTDSYLAVMEQQVLGAAVRPVGIAREAVTGLRGVPPAEVYTRAGVTVWSALADGVPYDEAAARGLRRALSIAETDMQMAERKAAQTVMAGKPGVVGYRRVLTGSESCAMCAIASTQRYRKDRLMPIHPGCDCKVAPIYGREDPGQVLNADRLEQIQDLVVERFGGEDRTGRNAADFRDLVVTHDHGEIGPVLARRGDTFTGPADVKPTKPLGRRANAGDLTRAQGDEIADAAMRMNRGDITRAEYRAIVNRVRNAVEG